MKKILIKTANVVVGLTLIIFLQEFIRSLFNIDRRIWFFLQFFGCFILLAVILIVFMTEIKFIDQYVKDNSWPKFWWLVWKKTLGSDTCQRIFTAIKNFFTKIFKSKTIRIIFKVVDKLVWWVVIMCIWYSIFFKEDFYSRHSILILFTISLVILCLIKSCKIIFVEKQRTKTNMILLVAWGIVALSEIVLIFTK